MTIIAPTYSGSANIGLKAQNTCGYSPYYYEGFIAEDCGYFLSVYPNPADKGYFEVEMVSSDENDSDLNTEKAKTTSKVPEEYQIKLYNDKMELVLELKTKEKKVQIDTRKLLKGTYFLHFSGTKGTVQRKVVVQ